MEALNNLEEPVKSSEGTGSGEPFAQQMSEDDIAEQKRKIVELSNESILHGFDMAVDILLLHSEANAVKLLAANRPLIEMGLKNLIDSQIQSKE